MNVMNKAIKYRLYPTILQIILFCKTFGCCRKLWNLMLSDKIFSYQKTGESLKNTPAQYKDEYPYLREVDSLALANVQLNLEKAYKNFFSNPKFGYPKYKSKKHDKQRYTTNNVHGSIWIDAHGIRLPKAGYVKASIHRMPGKGWRLKSATVSRDPDGRFYVSVLYEYEADIPEVPVSSNAIGLDYKSDGFYADSNGDVCGSPKYYRESQRKLARLQKNMTKKQFGSKNYEKAKRKAAKFQKHVSNQRLDFLHKKSAEIANQYDVICVEDLDIKAMSNSGFGNGKAMLDNGYGMFLDMLEYKMADRGKHFVKVDKWYPSSQICSCCGNKKRMGLSERVYTCSCGNVIDRDYNAAINIKREGLRMLAAA